MGRFIFYFGWIVSAFSSVYAGYVQTSEGIMTEEAAYARGLSFIATQGVSSQGARAVGPIRPLHPDPVPVPQPPAPPKTPVGHAKKDKIAEWMRIPIYHGDQGRDLITDQVEKTLQQWKERYYRPQDFGENKKMGPYAPVTNEISKQLRDLKTAVLGIYAHFRLEQLSKKDSSFFNVNTFFYDPQSRAFMLPPIEHSLIRADTLAHDFQGLVSEEMRARLQAELNAEETVSKKIQNFIQLLIDADQIKGFGQTGLGVWMLRHLYWQMRALQAARDPFLETLLSTLLLGAESCVDQARLILQRLRWETALHQASLDKTNDCGRFQTMKMVISFKRTLIEEEIPNHRQVSVVRNEQGVLEEVSGHETREAALWALESLNPWIQLSLESVGQQYYTDGFRYARYTLPTALYTLVEAGTPDRMANYMVHQAAWTRYVFSLCPDLSAEEVLPKAHSVAQEHLKKYYMVADPLYGIPRWMIDWERTMGASEGLSAPAHP